MSGWSVCPVCSAVVAVPEVHAAWHIAQEPPPEPVTEPVEPEPVSARWWPADVALVATPAVIRPVDVDAEFPTEPFVPDPLIEAIVNSPAPAELRLPLSDEETA